MKLTISRWLDQMPFPINFSEEPPDQCVDDYFEEMREWRLRVCAHRQWIRTSDQLVMWVTKAPAPPPKAGRLTQAEIDEINSRVGSGPP